MVRNHERKFLYTVGTWSRKQAPSEFNRVFTSGQWPSFIPLPHPLSRQKKRLSDVDTFVSKPTTSTTSTPNYVHEPLTSEHSRTQVQHTERPYHHWEQERLASPQQGTVARPHLHLPLPPPVVQVPVCITAGKKKKNLVVSLTIFVQPAPSSAPASLGKTKLSHPPPPQSPMSVHSNGQPAPRSVAAATIRVRLR